MLAENQLTWQVSGYQIAWTSLWPCHVVGKFNYFEAWKQVGYQVFPTSVGCQGFFLSRVMGI